MTQPDGEEARDRVRALTGPAADLLAVLAVWGGAASVEHLVAVSGLPAGALLAAVREAVAAGVLAWRDGERLEFVRTTDRDAVYADLAPALRRVLHSAHSAALEGADVLGRARRLAVAGRVDDAVLLARDQLAAVADPTVRTRWRGFLCSTLVGAARVDDARAEIDALLEVPLPREHQVRGLELRAWVDLLAGDVPVPDPAPEPEGPTALVNAALAALLRGRTVQATALATAGVDAGTGEPWAGAAAATVWPPWCRLLAEGPDAAGRDSVTTRTRAQRAGQLGLRPAHELVSAGIHVVAGRWSDAETQFDAGLAAAAAAGSGWISHAVAGRARLALDRGDVEAASVMLAGVREAGVPEQFGLPALAVADALVDEARGRPAVALARAREAWDAARAGGRLLASVLHGADLARLAVRAERPDVLASLARALRDDRPDGVLAAPVVALVTALDAGEPDAAIAAAEAFAAVGDVPGLLAAREEAACLAARAGDAVSARREAAAAREVATPLGAEGVLRRMAARLRASGVRLGAVGPRRRPVEGWSALTPTEQRVAELVADGVPGPEIAVWLAVSPRTVQTHVSNALRKLGLRTRVELAGMVPPRGAGTRTAGGTGSP